MNYKFLKQLIVHTLVTNIVLNLIICFVETVKDLIRYLRRDDDDHQIRRHLGNAKVLQTDLIPIMIHHSDKEDLFDVVLRYEFYCISFWFLFSKLVQESIM